MKIIIMHKTVAKFDAIGNDIESMYKILNKRYDCQLFAEYPENKSLSYISKSQLLAELNVPENIYIYHHSLNWELGEDILKEIKGKIIFRYHNITPPGFFNPYDPYQGRLCSEGRKQTEYLVKNYKEAIWLSDSNYNAKDIQAVEKSRSYVCPPFHKIEQWADAEDDIDVKKMLLENDTIHLLFVGRIVPNKGYIFLLDCLKTFIMSYHLNIKLNIIGKFNEGIAPYNEFLKAVIQEYGLQDKIEFIGEITDQILATYYRYSDLFLCGSEHEGFGVPLVEAQYFGLPIIALNSSAVPETIGEKQVVLNKDAKKFAAAINIINENKEYYNYLAEKGKDKYNSCYSFELLKEKFEKIIEKCINE